MKLSLLLALSLVVLGLHGCIAVHRLDEFSPCPVGYPNVPLDAEDAYRGIVGVEIDSSLAPTEVVGTYLRGDHHVAKLTLFKGGTAVAEPNHPFALVRHRYVGTWTYTPGQVTSASWNVQEGKTCSRSEPFDVVRVDGRVWLVETRMRPAVQDWFAWSRENGGVYYWGDEAPHIPLDYVFAVRQDDK